MKIVQLSLDEFESFKSKVIGDLEELKELLKNKNTDKKWLKSSEVRQLLGISHGTLQTLRNNSSITYSKIRGILYYKLEDVEKLLEQNASEK